MPFLSVITRTFRRPRLLANNQRSLAAQTDPDFEQIILRDDIGQGVAWANARLRDAADLPTGEYVMILDDDDLVRRQTLISELKGLAAEHGRPGVIMTRMDHGPRGVLPPADEWGRQPGRGRVGCASPVARRDVWLRCAPHYGAAYDGDYDYIAALFAAGDPVVWHPVIATAVQQIGLGRPEKVNA